MDDLDQLEATGFPVFDLNSEKIDRTDWSQTPLGPRESWPAALTTLVYSCIVAVPHCAAVFWGDELSIIHNLAWGKATGNLDGQGASARESYSGEALTSILAAVRGRTVKVAVRFFLKNLPEFVAESTMVLSTILDETGKRQGVLAQLHHNPTVEKYMTVSGLDKLSEQHPGRQIKESGSQQPILSDKDTEEQADSKQTQLFRKFAELLPNGLAILDSDAEAVFVNDAFFELTSNKLKNEFRAWPESIHSQDHERVMSEYRRAFSAREELRVEFRCVAPMDDQEQEPWRLFLLKPLAEVPEAGFIAAVVDITEIKRAQLTQEKAATEAQERKQQQERFIDMVSHEIRNPLSAVLHLAEEIKELSHEVEKKHGDIQRNIADILDAADTILLCVSHQNTLVDDILSFSKLDSMMLSLAPRRTQPKWEFASALKVFHSEFKAKNIEFHYAMDVSYDDLAVDYVMADLNRMKQVLVNLITNAIKFTSKKKGKRSITVSMGASIERPTSYPPSVIFFGRDEQAFHVDSTMSGDWGNGSVFYLMLAVKDTGIGISAEGQAKLFERFRQATPKTQENYGGSGLGLFISRKLCQLHGGDIGVSSKEGDGSTFGFFCKVRRLDGTLEDGRPSLGHRSTSESSSHSPVRAHLERPPFNRTRSALRNESERPSYYSVSSHEGINIENVAKSLKDPPTEFRQEAHPENGGGQRLEETKQIVEDIQQTETSQGDIIEKHGETERQHDNSEAVSQGQSRSSSKARRTILLVEDNIINQKVLRRQLQSKGFEVFVANNGQEAIDAVEERGRSAKENYFDCILMDQEMPIKDGNAATIEIRELQEHGMAGRSPILGVSANVREAQRESMLEAGMDEIISKPYKVEDLVKKINGILPKA
ncbi:two component histidine kinase 1 [Polyplosphaeria fusca]|uniref:Two component histidine kinase 1 n=1 Tax=Polyplosphaeria fusca TaxID=682080 RepID=A0A9P4V6Q9_9PLEO|nr:two component histidine kinase 1 [Polyplosphaeria fusca]